MSTETTPPNGISHFTPTTSFDDLVKYRHSIRFFKPDPVPKEKVIESLKLAQHAPSNSNTQPWRLFLASGAAHTRIATALMEAASKGPPNIPALPDQYKHFRSELGRQLYGEQGYQIPRDDRDRHESAVRRNFEFFGAPLVGVVCMDQALDTWDAMSVGMWLDTLMLALCERGLGTCLQVSVVGYPEVVRRELEIPGEMLLLCGIAIGVPVEDNRVNELVSPRQTYDSHLVWKEE